LISSSSKIDLLVKNGRIYQKGTFQDGEIAVKDGQIIAIDKKIKVAKADQIYDAKRNLVFPGFIDLHVHFRDPGYPDRETFYTGTLAAAAGGITLVGDMPNPNPPTTNTSSYSEKLKISNSKAVVDFHLYGGVNDTNLDQINSISSLGARLFKTYTTSKYKDLYVSSESSLHRIMKRTKANNSLLMIHAEDQSIINKATEKVKKKNQNGFMAHAYSRPPQSEIKMIKTALAVAKRVGAPIYICHVSTAEAVVLLRKSKKQGVKVFSETCPHYLTFIEEDGVCLGPFAKTNPPLRTEKDREALWKGLLDGTLDVISSDHCPYTVEEKKSGFNDIFSAPPGMPGLDTTLSIMLNHVKNGYLDYYRLVTLYSENPAKILGVYPKKGTISVGSDADITIVDPRLKWSIKGKDLYTKSKISMFEDVKLRGKPIATFVRGNLVMRNGKVDSQPGYGKFV
jgi:dihydropyrimidinase/allantoinase